MAFEQTDGLGRATKGARDGPRPLREHTRRFAATTTIFGCAKSRLARARGTFLVRPLKEFSGSRGLRLLRCRPGSGRILRLACRLGLGLCRIFVLLAGVFPCRRDFVDLFWRGWGGGG